MKKLTYRQLRALRYVAVHQMSSDPINADFTEIDLRPLVKTGHLRMYVEITDKGYDAVPYPHPDLDSPR